MQNMFKLLSICKFQPKITLFYITMRTDYKDDFSLYADQSHQVLVIALSKTVQNDNKDWICDIQKYESKYEYDNFFYESYRLIFHCKILIVSTR